MKKSQGFTLIEMLIVIAVIGVLAVAVLSAINPIEQMRKARDTRRRSNAAELLNALERYYSTNEAYPTTFPATVGSCEGTQADTAAIGELVSIGELKPEFEARVTTDTANYLYTYLDSDDLMHVCYEVEARANETMVECPTAGFLTGAADYACVPE